MTGLPRLDPERVADAVEALADQVGAADVRAQLVALAGIVRCLREPEVPDGAGAALARVATATDGQEHESLVVALRELGVVERGAVAAVDWTRASGG